MYNSYTHILTHVMNSTKLALTAFVVLVAILGAVSVAGAQMDEGMDSETNDSTDEGMDDGMTETETFTVRIENVAPTEFYASDSSTGGQVWVTPGAYAVHTESNPAFTEDESASVGLEAQAEAGPPTGFDGQPGLIDELRNATGVVTAGAFTPENTVADPNDPTGEVPGAPPIAPGGAFEFEVNATQGQRLSFATMFVPSNDLFFAPGSEGISFWEDGNPVSGDVTDQVTLWDAGTETNQEPGFGPDQAPAQSEPNQGDDEGGVVRPVSEVDDGFEYPSVSDSIRVTVTPQGDMGDGMGEEMDGGMNDEDMEDGSMDDESMEDEGMEDGSMDDESMEDEGMEDESTDDTEGGDSSAKEGGEGMPGFGTAFGVLAVLLVMGYMVVRDER
jgi:hypothetical protein